jgi:hypothetical protein
MFNCEIPIQKHMYSMHLKYFLTVLENLPIMTNAS